MYLEHTKKDENSCRTAIKKGWDGVGISHLSKVYGIELGEFGWGSDGMGAGN